MAASKFHNDPFINNIYLSWRETGARHLLVTLSGGADSTALLSALTSIGNLNITALHCNFHLRGDESMRDQTFVCELCNKLGVEVRVKDFNVDDYISAHKGISAEMACRELRYEWFREMLKDSGADRIVTGHNADDNIETLFLNLLRGSGTSGLRGMCEDTGEIWRPMLKVHREEILAYIDRSGLSYVTDSTNLESDYRRNFIRNVIIPLLKSKWPGMNKALDRSIQLLGNENKIVTKSVADHLPAEGEPLLRTTVLNYPDPESLVKNYIRPLNPFTTTAAEIVSAMRANKPDIKRWKLHKGMVTLRGGKLKINFEP